MGLEERFEDILNTWTDVFADNDRKEQALQNLLEAVCADRIEQGDDHDWLMERDRDRWSYWRIIGPCTVCGKEAL